MTPPVESLIDQLVVEMSPVTPLTPPAWRALAWLGVIGSVLLVAIGVFSDASLAQARSSGREVWLALEVTAMLATAAIAILGAFYSSIPGASRRWLAAPLPFFMLWLILSGLGCFANPARRGATAPEPGGSGECLLFIVATSVVLAVPLIWRLSRARPIDPLPVAVLGGLGIAALSAFVLVFFHPFTVTFLDLAVHVAALLIVVAAMALIGGRALATPASATVASKGAPTQGLR